MRYVLSYIWISFHLMVMPARAQVVINEFMPDPSSENDATEWIELFNLSEQEVNVTEWQLDDEEGGSKPFVLPDLVIPSYGFIVIHKQDSGIGLNNNGDSVRLINPTGELIDTFTYTQTTVDYSYARHPDGVGEWLQSAMITQGNTNGQTIPSLTPTSTVKTARIRLSEIYACPPPNEAEWFEVVADETGSLEEFKLFDKNNNSKQLYGTIDQGDYVSFTIEPAFLNNDGDEIGIKDSNGMVVDTMTYSPCTSGRSLIKENNVWIETTTPTKNAANISTYPSTTPANASSTPKPAEPTHTPKPPVSSPTIRAQPTLDESLKEPNAVYPEASISVRLHLEDLTIATSQANIGANPKHSAGPGWFILSGLCFLIGGCWPLIKRFPVVFHN